jgi:uncharacterized protein DUF6931
MPGPSTLLNSGKTVEEICQAAEVSADGCALLDVDTDARGFVERLAAQDRFTDAVRFLAHALPPRPAVWWAWYCARRAHGTAPAPKVQAALEATQRWIAQPADPNRREAMRCAQEVEFRTPAGCAGLAAFFTGESIGPADRDPVPPPQHVAGRIISSCVALAAVFQEPAKAKETFQEFVRQGIEVADKTQLWTPPPHRGR